MNRLRKHLSRIDGKGYKAYKDIKGKYDFSKYRLAIDHVQGDPFASPSKIRFLIPTENTIFQSDWFGNRKRKIALEDHIARIVAKKMSKMAHHTMGTGKSGMISIDGPGQEVLERTAVNVTENEVTICLSIGLPARGRTVLGHQAAKLFFEHLPEILENSIFDLETEKIKPVMKLTDQQQIIRKYMVEQGLVSFIADGSVLPRESGISNRPLTGDEVIPFEAPEEMAVTIPIPHCDHPIRGMGVKKGITLIVGGGYHGKSTLLQAIERGVYDHVKGDGREFVLTDPSAYKIRAEDGRKVTSVNISPFIQNLPHGKDTNQFTTENASGSTSQASNIIEAIGAGAQALLIDEDTSATNFMIRDSRMQALVAKQQEPITPFIDKVRQLYDEHEVSTILVMGGSGDYFDVADKVVMMEQYRPFDVTEEAKKIIIEKFSERQKEGGVSFGQVTERIPLPGSLNSRKGKKEKIATRGLSRIQYGTTDIELDQVEQLVDSSQTRAISEALKFIEKRHMLGKVSLSNVLEEIERQIEEHGLASLSPFPDQHPGELARPRVLEIAAALNRLRTLKIKS